MRKARAVPRGRDEELRFLGEALEQATVGPVVVCVTGPPGIGRTALVEQFAAQCRDARHAVLVGAAVPFGTDQVLLPVLTALGDVDADRADVLLAATHRRVVELATEQPAHRPLVLVLEDLQWADATTLAFVGMICRGMAPHRLLLVVTCRDDAPSPVAEALREWDGLGAENVAVGPLPDDVVARIVDDRLETDLPAPERRRLVELAAGNPFYAEQIVRSATTGSLSDRLLERLLAPVDRLGTTAQAAVSMLALLDGASPEVVKACWAGCEQGYAAALLEANRAGIITLDHEGPRFTHPLVRDAVRGRTDPVEAAALVRRAAEIATRVSAEPRTSARDRLATESEVARLWDRAGSPERALAHRALAGGAAVALGAFEEAYALLTAVLEEPYPGGVAPYDPFTAHRDLAAAAAGLGNHEEAVQHAEWALGILDRGARPFDVLRTRIDLAGYRWAAQRTSADEVRADLTDVLAQLPEDAVAERVRADELLARVLGDVGLLVEAQVPAEEAVRLSADGADPLARSAAQRILGAVQVHLGLVDEGLGRMRDALTLAQKADDPGVVLATSRDLAVALNRVGRVRESVDTGAAALAEGRRRGASGEELAVLTVLHVDSLVDLGRWDEADTIASRALALRPPPFARIAHGFLRGVVALRRGDHESARRAHEELAPEAATHRETALAAAVFGAELAVHTGDVGALRRTLATLDAADLRPGTQLDRIVTLAVRGEVDAAHSPESASGATAWEQIEHLAEQSGRSTVPFRRAMQLLGDAERTRRHGGAGDAGAWADALRAWELLDSCPYETAYCRMRHAAALPSDEVHRARALAELDRAESDVAALGAGGLVPLLRRVRAAVAPVSVPLPRPTHAGGGQGAGDSALARLTPRERQVLLLLTSGLSNRRVARTLDISEKTVVHHVSRVLDKLGVGSRLEAAAFAHRQGMVPAAG